MLFLSSGSVPVSPAPSCHSENHDRAVRGGLPSRPDYPTRYSPETFPLPFTIGLRYVAQHEVAHPARNLDHKEFEARHWHMLSCGRACTSAYPIGVRVLPVPRSVR